LKYRAEIDGLRALAVLPVILFHAGFEWFSGGFVGVDVFFVISGYLITTIIISEMAEGKFSIFNFYERRARRILPALFFVMAACLPFAWLWLTPTDLKGFGQSLVAVSTFSSNILFWLESGYFDKAAELKPLLHTWSLAVEEQYYILFPIFLILTWRLGIKTILILLSIVFLVSLGVAVWGTQYAAHPKIISGAFFLLPTRGWELLVGVFAAFYLKYNTHLKSHSLNQALSLLGFGMIFYSIIVFDKTTPFPSLYALIPTIGTGLIILCAVSKTFIHKLLSLKFIVGIGLISYSAYLWHQPLLAFARHRSLVELSDFLLIILCAASLVMAWLSWRFVEVPFRDKKKIKRSSIFLLSGFILFMFSGIGLLIHFNSGFSDRLPTELQSSNLNKKKKECNFEFSETVKIEDLNKCISPADIFLVGDSHAASIGFALEKELQKTGQNLIVLTHNGCLPIKNIGRKNQSQSCKNFVEFLYNDIFINNNTVVLSSRWRLNIEGTRYNNGEGGIESGSSGQVYITNQNSHKDLKLFFVQKIREIKEVANLIIINQIPEVGINVPKWYFFKFDTPLTHSYAEYKIQNNSINEMFESIEGIKVLQTDILVCNDKSLRCITRLGEEILYFDDDHPSTAFAELIAEQVSILHAGRY
jgi:peptidoglycan/LPS O-acetylase OafA/YrhL